MLCSVFSVLCRIDLSKATFYYILTASLIFSPCIILGKIKLACCEWWSKSSSNFVLGWQQTSPPDNWHSHDHPGDLWEVWSSFHNHSRPSHRRDVPCYVWNDCSSGDVQPPGILTIINVLSYFISTLLCKVSIIQVRKSKKVDCVHLVQMNTINFLQHLCKEPSGTKY